MIFAYRSNLFFCESTRMFFRIIEIYYCVRRIIRQHKPRVFSLYFVNIAPSTWSDIDEIQTEYAGFVLSDNTPYTIIDLDNPEKHPGRFTKKQIRSIRENHRCIIAVLNSYTERSINNGFHIVVKGKLSKNINCQSECIEAYSRDRYIIITGDQYKHYCNIAYRQNQLDRIYKRYKKDDKDTVEFDNEEYDTDDNIINRLHSIRKFADLFENGYTDNEEYPSNSEADCALYSLIKLETMNESQIERIFLRSALGKRKKAHRKDYLKRTLNNSYNPPDYSIAEVDFDSIRGEKNTDKLTFPPGLVGDIAQYIYATSYIPMHESAICSALGFCAGLFARSYTVSRSRNLNLFLILLAKTGMGKNELTSGAARLFEALIDQIPAIISQINIQTYIASGQALLKDVTAQPCKAYFMGEFAEDLRRWYKGFSSTDIELFKTILKLFDNDTIGNMIYSREEDHIKGVKNPSVSIVGETVPFKYFELLDVNSIDSGFTPRFVHFLYTGKRSTELNEKHGKNPSKLLVDKIVEEYTVALDRLNSKNIYDIKLSKKAAEIFENFRVYAIKQLNVASENAVYGPLWNRAHLKALKIAALTTIGDGFEIKLRHANWAIDLIQRDIRTLTDVIEKDVYGVSSNAPQKILQRYFIELSKTENGITFVTKRDIAQRARRMKAFINPHTHKFDTAGFNSELFSLISEGFCH